MTGNRGTPAEMRRTSVEDEYLFGWDPTPGIVSVWAQRDGRALVWRRDGERVICERTAFRPWLFATTLDDLAYTGAPLRSIDDPRAERAPFTFRELDGPDGSYRFLLTASSGSMLERTLLEGASRRLGRPITSLYDLEERYYSLGPVEQYLMSTGRTSFRDLAYDDLHRLQFDLETTALDPHQGRIFMVAMRDSRGWSTTLEARGTADEPGLIARLCTLIRERDPDVIENHNLHGFDLPFLFERARRLRVPLTLGRPEVPPIVERYADPRRRGAGRREHMRISVPGREMIDTLDAVLRYDFGARDLPGYRLKEVARYFGVAPPDRVYLAGEAIYETYRREPELVRHYALDDVAEVDGLSRRLLGAPFTLASMAPRRYERLASAGPAMGILEPMLVRAYLRAGAALPAYGESEAGGEDAHLGGAVHLFAEGVAEQVVKADIASLYPSLMRTFQIGPACDRLGVVLSLVDRLTDLRLAHKSAARNAVPGSLEAGHHAATQTAMKILINSAYGYMGAGRMALFADMRAAGEVTRRGREVLDGVLAALRQRGMALVEADTDGVYFAVPAGWTETEERALVEAIAATLPPGIHLEYEGRYRAMFSHEVKNYALLTYGGELVVRGVALRSSRAEPFGEQFLRGALRSLMAGDMPALRQVFLETAAAIRSRELPAAELAVRARLSKTPAAYLATRETHREAPYEALLAGGRTTWAPGERVRFYRARGGAFVWLPDESDELAASSTGEPVASAVDARDYDVEHYLRVLVTTYAGRLRKAFTPADFERLFRLDGQAGLFDTPIEQIEPRWIRCRDSDLHTGVLSF